MGKVQTLGVRMLHALNENNKNRLINICAHQQLFPKDVTVTAEVYINNFIMFSSQFKKEDREDIIE